MKFCLLPCNDINFEPDAIQPCCGIRRPSAGMECRPFLVARHFGMPASAS